MEHSYPMGPMMGRENALMKSAVYGVFVRWVELCRRHLFVVHAKEGRTKTSVVVEIDVCSTNITFFTSIDGTVQILLLILGNENFISHMLHITYLHFIVVSFRFFLPLHSCFFFYNQGEFERANLNAIVLSLCLSLDIL